MYLDISFDILDLLTNLAVWVKLQGRISTGMLKRDSFEKVLPLVRVKAQTALKAKEALQFGCMAYCIC